METDIVGPSPWTTSPPWAWPAARPRSYARAPVGLLAELTHRCPLQCPYCSNPLELERVNRELPTEAWVSVMRQAGEMGILQVHLSGGEPREDAHHAVESVQNGIFVTLSADSLALKSARLPAVSL
jgi:pyrroloquinoline quinone biosynthesis protein E